MRANDEIDLRSFGEKSYDVVEALASMVRMTDDPRVQHALRIIAADPNDSDTVREVAAQTAGLICRTRRFKRVMRNPLPFQPLSPGIQRGAIPVGMALDPVATAGCPVALSARELGENILCAGRAGSGKTNFIYGLIHGLLNRSIPWWAVDFKRDYRHVLRWSRNVRVFNPETAALPLLRPPSHTPPQKWLQIVADVFAQIFLAAASPASKSLLMDVLDDLYRQHGVYDGSGACPTLADLDRLLDPAHLKGRVSAQDLQRVHTLRNKLHPLVKLLGPMACTDPGLPLEALLQENVVFELDGLAAEYQEFVVNLLLHWAFAYRIGKGERGALKQILIFDEAKMVYAKSRATATSYITRVTSMAREYGIGLVVADQMPSSLGQGIKANVFATVAFNQASIQDANDMASTLGLDDLQRQYLRIIPVGTAIVRLADRHVWPFLMRVPKATVRKDVSDAEVAAHMAPYLAAHGDTPAAPVGATGAGTPEPPGTGRPTALDNEVRDHGSALDPVAARLLTDVRDRPYIGCADRFRGLGLRARQGTNAVKALVAGEYLRKVIVVTGQRGRPPVFLEFLPRAAETMGRQKLGPGRGGLCHRFWQQRAHAYYVGLGYQARIEAHMNGKAVDVGVWKPGRKVAVEIAVSPAHEVENVRKDIQSGWDDVVVAARDATVLEHVKHALDEALPEYGQRVRLIPVTQLVM